jgi:hypothetical protein
MNKTVYEYVTFSHFSGDSHDLRKIAKDEIWRNGGGYGKIAWDSNAEFVAKPLITMNISGVSVTSYRGRFKLTKPLRKFEIREGNGNDGEYHRGYIEAWDAHEALRIASRDGMIVRPWDVKLSDMQGDDTHAYLVSYVAPIYGDSCRWCASANLVSE